MAKYIYIGAIWLREGAKGKYESISVDAEKVAEAVRETGGSKLNVSRYRNDKKTDGDKRPDYNLCVKVSDTAPAKTAPLPNPHNDDLPF